MHIDRRQQNSYVSHRPLLQHQKTVTLCYLWYIDYQYLYKIHVSFGHLYLINNGNLKTLHTSISM